MSSATPGEVIAGYLLPNQSLPVLAPEANEGWAALRAAGEQVRAEIEASEAEVLMLFSTRWVSIIGHQMLSDPAPEWWAVDEDFHEFGSLHYKLRVDAELAESYASAAGQRGLHARTVNYHGFPVDVGTIAALRIVNPDNRLPVCVVSCNAYSDRSETLVLGKAAADAVRASGKKAVAIGVTAFSNRMFSHWIEPKDDRIHSQKDDEWNRKLLELLGEGRLEDVSQLAREFSRQANGDSRMKALWWLAATLGQHNDYTGTVFEYQPVWGTGAALVGLQPGGSRAGDLEYDEDDAEFFRGDRNVLSSTEQDD